MKNKKNINLANKLAAVLLAALLIAAFVAGCTEVGPEPSYSQPPVVITAPGEVQAFAKDVMSEHLAITQLTFEGRSEECSTLLTGLEIIETGTAGLDFSVEVYRLEYDLTEANKMSLRTTETVRYLVVLWNGLENTEFIRLGVLTNEMLDEEYSTPEMQEEYGGAVVAAAMELYHKWQEENPWRGTFTFEAEILTISEDRKHLRVKTASGEKAVEIYRDTKLYDSDWNLIAAVDLIVGQTIEVTAQSTVVYEPVETCWAEVIKILQDPVQEEDPEAALISYFQKMLTFDGGETWYNGALTCTYDSPENINLEYVFYTAFPSGEEWHDFTPDEQAYLINEGAKKNLGFGHIPVQKRTAEQLDEALRRFFGVSLSEVRIPDSWVYYEATDSYYSSHGDIHVMEDFSVTKVEHGEGGLVYIYYTAYNPIFRQDGVYLDGWEYDMVLTMQSKAGNLVSPDGYVVVSNQPNLEELQTEPYNIQDVVNRILVGEIKVGTEWNSMGGFTMVSTEPSGKVDLYHGTPGRYYDLSSTPGHELMEFFRWSRIDASEWAALSENSYLLEFSNDWYSFTVCSYDNKIAIEVNGETLYYEGDPVYDSSVFSLIRQYAEAALFEHEYDVCQVSGSETDYDVIAQKLAEQYAQCILDRPGWATQRAVNAQVRDVEVFDAYYGEDNPNFCFDKRLYLKVTEEQWFFWQVGSGLDGPYTEGLYEGWSGHGMQVRVRKKEDGNWHMTGMVTGGSSVTLPVGLRDATVSQLVEWYFLTEGWTHEWLIVYRLSEMPIEEIKENLDKLEDEQCRELTDALLEFVTAYPEYAVWKAEDL